MKREVVQDDLALSAKEFYDKYHVEESFEDLNIFNNLPDDDDDDDDYEGNEDESANKIPTTSADKPAFRLIAKANDVIVRPPEDPEELISCFRERLHVQSDLQFTSVQDQRVLAEVLILAIISVWPDHRKLAPDPFMTEMGNTELERGVAVCIIETVEKLFYDYVAKAEEWNRKQVFSTEANLSRIKTQVLQEANDLLDVFKVRRKTMDRMHSNPLKEWMLEPTTDSAGITYWDIPSKHEISTHERHKQLVDKHLKELDTLMPDLAQAQRNSEYDVIVKNYLSAAANHDDKHSNRFAMKSSLDQPDELKTSRDLETEQLSKKSQGQENTNLKIERCKSMPLFDDISEIHEEFKEAQNLAVERRLSVNQELVNVVVDRRNASKTKDRSFSVKEDLTKLMDAWNKSNEKSVIDEDDFSALLQVHNKRATKHTTLHNSTQEKKSLSRDRDVKPEEVQKREEMGAEQQPAILNVKVPRQNIVRICDIGIENRSTDSELILQKHVTIYNEFLSEINDETVKSLDKHVYVGAEVREVYNEISKSIDKSYLTFDKDVYVEDHAAGIQNMNELFMSDLLVDNLHWKHNANELLPIESEAPWMKFTNPHEWRNEPKFAGVGREDMVKISGKVDWRSNRKLKDEAALTGNEHLTKAYPAWLAWYRSSINAEDYKKFISTKETDFLCQIFHLYEADDSHPTAEDERTSAQLANLRKHEEECQRLLAEKNKYETGYWNAQCVSLGGLGKEPNFTQFIVNSDLEAGGLVTNMKDEDDVYVYLQDRLEQIWIALKMPDQQRLDMAIKHSGKLAMTKLAEVVECWEKVSELIVRREVLMEQLETFERTASDPNRFFEKGANGSPITRMNESKVRAKLSKQIQIVSSTISRLLRYIKITYNDDVTFRGRNYASKMECDRVEMLYWLQQERRKEHFKSIQSAY